jgi:hypothetical protein
LALLVSADSGKHTAPGNGCRTALFELYKAGPPGVQPKTADLTAKGRTRSIRMTIQNKSFFISPSYGCPSDFYPRSKIGYGNIHASLLKAGGFSGYHNPLI